LAIAELKPNCNLGAAFSGGLFFFGTFISRFGIFLKFGMAIASDKVVLVFPAVAVAVAGYFKKASHRRVKFFTFAVCRDKIP